MRRLLSAARPVTAVLLLLLPWGALPARAGAQTRRPDEAPAPYVHDVWQTEDGLPHNGVHALLQTRDGYLWLGTAAGLARFDGVRFVLMGDVDATPIKNSYVWALQEDREGALWIGAGGGLVRYKDGHFTSYTTADGLADNFVRALYEDSRGYLWIGTYGGGLSRYRDGHFTSYTTADGLADNVVYQVLEDHEGTLWVGTAGGLSRFQGARFTSYATGDEPGYDDVFAIYEDRAHTLWIGTGRGLHRFVEGRLASFPGREQLPRASVRAIYQDREGSLWIGTEGGGLFRLKDGGVAGYAAGGALSHNDVRALYQDHEGSLWIGTNGGGLNRFQRARVAFYGTEEGLAGDVAFSVYETRDGAVWIGTSGGLSRFEGGRFTAYTTRQGLSSQIVFSLCEDRAGSLWIGTMGGGLNRMQHGRFTAYTTRDGLANNDVFALYEDRAGNLWVGTGSGLGLFKAGTFITYTSADGLAEGIVVAIHQDRSGALWVATDGGLSRFEDGKFTTYTTADGLPGNNIRALYEDAAGTLWIGTRGGLGRFKGGRFAAFTARQGLLDEVVYQILEDDAGNLWLNGSRGLFRVGKQALEEVAEGTLRAVTPVAYGRADGMRSSEGNGGQQPAGWKTRDGRLWFPTLGGVVVVDPARIHTNRAPPPVHIEALVVDDSLLVGDGRAGPVIVPPGKRHFEFQYTSLSFLAPDRVAFKYRLEGLDEDWVEAGTRRQAYYTNLAPGSYTFRVLARNSDGVWNEDGASLSFTLRPFFYQTAWFFALCLLALGAGAAGAYRLRVRHLRAREEVLVRLVEDRTRSLVEEKQKTEAQAQKLEEQAKKLLEMDRLKSNFFANISHEFRTPLTLILGPLEDVLAETDEPLGPETRTRIDVAFENARRLLRLISQLLDLSKLEAGRMELAAARGNVADFVRRVVFSFTSLAERRQIELRYEPEAADMPLFFDPDKLEKVLYNLLSNALKFTPEGGKVWVTVRNRMDEREPGQVEIVVRDTGCGIAKEDLPYVFDRFHRGGNVLSHQYEGTGIGLALAKELVELHGGQIVVESTEGFGSTFMVRIPSIAFSGETAILEEPLPIDGAGRAHDILTLGEAEQPVPEAALPEPEPIEIFGGPKISGPKILIVEDNADVRAYLREHLQEAYQVEEAVDGVEGVEKAWAAPPDLVISDVMMPRRDGYELCRLLKGDTRTSHVPVILLTARADEKSKLEGLEIGADDYLYKPFSVGELQARVHNLLAARAALRERFSREVVIQPSGIAVPSIDEAFLEKAVGVVEANLADAHFGVDALADEMGLSARQLQRRLRALTGQSPADFIRHIRLQRAAQLLEQHAGTVAEIAYAVGFNKPAYFSELFRKTFGTSPSTYADEE